MFDGDDNPVVFPTVTEAQREIADNTITRLQQFLDGERDFDDAITVAEFIRPVTRHPDGIVVDEDGNQFGRPRSPVSGRRGMGRRSCG